MEAAFAEPEAGSSDMGVTLRTAAVLTLGAAVAALGACASPSTPKMSRLAARTRCADESFPIYFARGSAELTEPARQVIGSASGRIAGCRVTAVDVRGIAAPDAPGTAADGGLTQSRADNVAKALAAAGLPAPAFDVELANSSRPAGRPGRNEPLPRRTEVVLHARPQAS